ncbi:MAG: pilin [Patescibacteria group bacterium]
MNKRLGFSLFLLLILVTPFFASAQSLVPCGLTDKLPNQCEFCDLIELIQRVINFIIVKLAAPVATLLIAFAGIKLIVKADNETSRTEAKQLLKDILVGFLWILLAWSVILAVLNVLVKNSPQDPSSNWFKLKCFRYPVPEADFRTFQGGNAAYPVRPQDCPNCVELSRSEFNIKNNGKVNPSILPNMNVLKTELEKRGIKTSDWQITEAWPPTTEHKNECHRYGTCFDANTTDMANITKFSEAANVAKLRAVYEVGSQEEANKIKSQLSKDAKVEILVLPPINGKAQITAPHFSVYKI